MNAAKVRAFSRAGLSLALIYAVIFAAAYARYLVRAKTWFADLPLVMVSTPFILPMRWLNGGSYDYAGDMSARVLAAAAWGMALAYVVGWALEALIRALVSAASRR